jgi:dihydroorotate dehydrogenase (NAD+) catalytic subunit
VTLVRRASEVRPAAIELNLSCPNVSHGEGSRCFAQSSEDTFNVVRAAKTASRVPIVAKLSPEVADVKAIALAAEQGGADAVSLINTLPGMVIDVENERPVLANRIGGLSGPALHPVAVRCVWEVSRTVKIPILGYGGVASGRDAVELILAGATAVGIGTANFWNPRAAEIILAELERLVAKKKRAVTSLIGAVKE